MTLDVEAIKKHLLWRNVDAWAADDIEALLAEVERLRGINTDLLAACQDALAVFDRYIHSETEDAAGIERIRAAIAKAVQP